MGDTPFVILRNIFPIEDTQIDEVYDLKGSTCVCPDYRREGVQLYRREYRREHDPAPALRWF